MSKIVSRTLGEKDAPRGEAPSIVLADPKFAHNVGMVVRLASCYGWRQVWYTGDRVAVDVQQRGRLPREERMKGYRDVSVINTQHPLDWFPRDVVPVAVEVRATSETLPWFEHPERAVYVFGPEDGSLDKALLVRCHRFVVVPVRHCMNLATTVATLLWDRRLKRLQQGLPEEVVTPGEHEGRGYIEAPQVVEQRG